MKELKRLLPYLSRYRTKLIWGGIFVTISNICSSIIPRIVGNIIDLIKSGNFTSGEIIILIIAILGLTAGSGLFMFLTRQTIIVASRLIEYDLRKDFLLSIEKQSSSFFQKNPTGSLMAHATNDIGAAREFLGPAIMYSANTLTAFTFVMYFMLSLDVNLTLLSLVPLPIIAYSVYHIGKRVHFAFRDVQEQFSNLTSHAQESFSGAKIVRSYNREEYERGKFEFLSFDYLKKNVRLAKYQSYFVPIIITLIGLSNLIVLAYGGYEVLHDRATLGKLTQFFIYINMLIWPVAAIGWVTNLVQRAAASTRRLGKIFDTVPELINDDNTDFSIKDINGNISFDNVSLKYDSNNYNAIENINLEIPKGSSLGIVGGIGSGKSSLINLIPRYYDVSIGEIYIDDIKIKQYPLELLRKNIGIVPQEPFLFSLSIADNIRFGNPIATEEEVEYYSKIAQLHDDVLTFPDKYNTLLGERGITLSGGQKQRLAIARALIKNPSILILDDALSAVDTQTEDKLLKELDSIMQGRTTIIISHRISTVMKCDKIIVLDSGKIIEEGNHIELVQLDGRYAEMFSLQQLEEEIEMM
ncbi:MAG: ABC transporter ATP-binding protein [Bacteroidetes bacterium]|nr:MAG: ABC transporter ATP-binding protein [Bacteroidota bacterium]